ncbi:NAD(P)H-hydrate dehydratase [Prosthecochloris sp. ZM_2]|uniref:NAD(P)H-hydrate dehydratase n=1 Tax=Prosthecochloris sp. ZM_2 TaxID=2045206 RepID=UPI000DF85774|nr:NAD(P)H-hydrate dehydratase [Prosthecochloris sp. ZM_2]RNA64996.1 NAD(P)H-hydrate dehydratase [Prosthecochloris sp. ZM_2]
MNAIVTGKEMAQADNAAIDKLLTSETRLMELAGRQAAEIISRSLHRENGQLHDCGFLILCGKGNNGGDGFVLARHLLNKGASVDVVTLYPPDSLKDINREGLGILQAYASHSSRLRLFATLDDAMNTIEQQEYTAIIDALLGTGLNLEHEGVTLRDPVRSAIELINSRSSQNASPVIALDLPSGLDATTGYSAAPTIRADMTITMAYRKTGFFFNAGPELTGEVHTAEISIPPFLLPETCCREIDDEYASACFTLRSPSSAKHTNGKLLIIAGSLSPEASMTGAAILATRAALACGTGYVCTSLPLEAAAALHATAPAATVISRKPDALEQKIRWADAIVLGCGLGRTPADLELVRRLVTSRVFTTKKVVLDADALFALAESGIDLAQSGMQDAVLTPHNGEFSRLTGLAIPDISADPIMHARVFSRNHNVTLLLKGNPTVISSPQGKVHLNTSGTEALATAGTGDILSGMIGALAAKGCSTFEAASAASWFHARAGDLAHDISSLVTAEQVVHRIPEAISEMFSITPDTP